MRKLHAEGGLSVGDLPEGVGVVPQFGQRNRGLNDLHVILLGHTFYLGPSGGQIVENGRRKVLICCNLKHKNFNFVISKYTEYTGFQIIHSILYGCMITFVFLNTLKNHWLGVLVFVHVQCTCIKYQVTNCN